MAARNIAPYLCPGNLVILESTVPPGTTQKVLAPILEESGLIPQCDLLVAHSPERVLPGRILEELVSNDRVIGGLTPEAAEAARKLYASFVQGVIHLTDATTAELVKLMGSGVGVLGASIDDAPYLVCVVSEDDISKHKLKAGDLVRELGRQLGGGGGGKPHMATAGGKDVSKLETVVNSVTTFVGEKLG